jgi:hypothetical protein
MLTRQEKILSYFDEQQYLACYEDVARAVAEGWVSSGREHFETFGLAEGRLPNAGSRMKKLLGDSASKNIQGLEIGALNNPALKRPESKVLYVDYTDRAGLIKHYADEPQINPQEIVEVDAIWGENKLSECLPIDFGADLVVASHVIEHVPDILGWLNEISEVLNSSGELRLAIPDKRYTFDVLRRLTQLDDILDAFVTKPRKPKPLALLDYMIWHRQVNCDDIWLGEVDLDKLAPVCTVPQALTRVVQALKQNEYYDAHVWVFTPKSFCSLMEVLSDEGLLRYECVSFYDTSPLQLEFFAGLSISHDIQSRSLSWRRAGELTRE